MSTDERRLTMATYTAVWRIERKLYKIHDFELPRPVAAGEAVAFVGFGLVLAAVLVKAGVPFNQYTGELFVVPPVIATWWARRPVADAKTLPAWLAAQARSATEPKILDGLVPRREPGELHLRGAVQLRPGTPLPTHDDASEVGDGPTQP